MVPAQTEPRHWREAVLLTQGGKQPRCMEVIRLARLSLKCFALLP
jgi:hypothetical protein